MEDINNIIQHMQVINALIRFEQFRHVNDLQVFITRIDEEQAKLSALLNQYPDLAKIVYNVFTPIDLGLRGKGSALILQLSKTTEIKQKIAQLEQNMKAIKPLIKQLVSRLNDIYHNLDETIPNYDIIVNNIKAFNKLYNIENDPFVKTGCMIFKCFTS